MVRLGRGPEAAASYRPMHPYWVLLIALLLPGVGQVVNNNPPRGLMMVFSILALGWISYHLTTPEHSWAGRYAGGLFVYAVSVLDAYRWARYRSAYFARKRLEAEGDNAG
jgi:hypothetical protein